MNSPIYSDLSKAREHLAAMRFEHPCDHRQLVAHLETLAGMFTRVSRDQFRELSAQVHNCAGKLPYVDDCDYGALVLESVSDSAASAELRLWILTEARFRALWCVQGATAGGEVIARGQHLDRLDKKIQSCRSSLPHELRDKER